MGMDTSNLNPSDQMIKIHLSEFSVMHNQILERARIQQTLLNIGFVLIGALVAFIGSNWIQITNIGVYNYGWLLFLFLAQFPFYGIVNGFAYQDIMIGTTAGYIHNNLKNKIEKVAKTREFWDNEEYFKRVREKQRASYLSWLGSYIIPILLLFPFILLWLAGSYIVIHASALSNQPISAISVLFVLAVIDIAFFIISTKNSFGVGSALINIIKNKN